MSSNAPSPDPTSSAPPTLILAGRHRALTGSSRELSRRYRAGALVRVRTGIYYPKGAWISLKPWERYAVTMAAVAALEPSTTFCYLTGLRVWGLPWPGVPGHIHAITHSPHKAGAMPPTTTAFPDAKTGLTGLERLRGYGVRRHHWPSETVQHRGYRVTSLIQTVLDCVVRLELTDALAIVDAVLGGHQGQEQRLTRPELRDAASCLSAAKRRRVEEVLALADEACESVGESRSRALFRVLGLPAPLLQQSFHDSEGFIARTDFFWPEFGVIGEFDGDAKYLEDDLLGDRSTREALLAEKKREDRLRALGYKVVRWDWKTLSDPDLLGRKLRAAGIESQKSPRVGHLPHA